MSDRDPGSPTRAGSGWLARWLRFVKPNSGELKTDIVAGLPGAIGSVPDGMASGILAGVNPIHGLYASFAGPIAGGLSASTRRMVITTTTAASLAAGSAVSKVGSADRPAALALLTLLAGVAMVLAGAFHLGRYTRFVTHSVMIGFLTGVAVNIILGQLADLFGVPAHGSIALEKAWNVLVHPAAWQLSSLFTGLAALAILFVFGTTRFAIFGAIVALVVPTIAVIVLGLDDVAQRLRRRCDPERPPPPRPAALVDVDPVAARRSVGGGGDRARAGCRRGGVGAQPRRHRRQRQPGLRRARRRQPRGGRLQGSARRRLGGADRAERRRRGAVALGVDLQRASGWS